MKLTLLLSPISSYCSSSSLKPLRISSFSFSFLAKTFILMFVASCSAAFSASISKNFWKVERTLSDQKLLYFNLISCLVNLFYFCNFPTFLCK